jgi:hypothetical protein
LREYTREGLQLQAQAAGYDVSPRLITDWTELGLLDSPRRAGRGKGQGRGNRLGVWSENQLNLLLTLLDKRRQGVHINSLCNIPVWLWLYCGDDYASLDQVKRALDTWSDANKTVVNHKARAVAKEMVDSFSHPKAAAEDRKKFAKLVARMATEGRVPDDELVTVMRRVIDPDPDGDGLVPTPIGKINMPSDYVELIKLRLRVLENVRGLPDGLYEWARFHHLTWFTQYVRQQPQMSADRRFGQLFKTPGVEEMMNHACIQLVSVLGMGLDLLNTPSNGSLRHPRTWIDHPITADIRAGETPGGMNIGFQAVLRGRRESDKKRP